MKYLIGIILLLNTVLIYGQKEFTFTKNELNPKYLQQIIKDTPKSKLYKQTLLWAMANYKKKAIITDTLNNQYILYITDIKENAIKNNSKKYAHLKYQVKISFANNSYKLQPLKIASKLNSKYDMGWKTINPINIKNRKNSKKLMKTLTVIFNKINKDLHNHLLTKKNDYK